jgi:hypothetical protein
MEVILIAKVTIENLSNPDHQRKVIETKKEDTSRLSTAGALKMH